MAPAETRLAWYRLILYIHRDYIHYISSPHQWQKGVKMAQHHQLDPESARIIHWLKEHREEFEQGSLEEMRLADSIGLTRDEITRGLDHLENREAVVRFPHPSSTPRQMMIKPGRGWQDLLEKEAGVAARQ
jgi:hypothetical protein